jgi:glycosyltransferase involved in cell wall biosynthesis
MNWSVALIAKNEAKTLPRLMLSLHEFRERGGEIILVDTGSEDGTPIVAREYGCIVF